MNSFVCDWSRRSVPAFRWDKKRGEEEEEEEEGRKSGRRTFKKERKKEKERKGKRERDLSRKKSREIGFVIRFHIATPINYNFLFNLCETRFIKLVPRSVNFYGEREREITKIYLRSIFLGFHRSFRGYSLHPFNRCFIRTGIPVENTRKHHFHLNTRKFCFPEYPDTTLLHNS